MPADLVTAQIEAVASDITLHATKTGMLGNTAIVEAFRKRGFEPQAYTLYSYAIVQIMKAAIEEAMVVREPITVVVSDKGWIRALRGVQTDLSGVAFKTDDSLRFAFPAETTSKIIVFSTNGRFYTIDASKLPGGRGHGEPVRLFADMEQEADLVAAFRYQGGRKFLVGSKAGKGFVVAEDEILATTRKGKQVLNVKAPVAEAVNL